MILRGGLANQVQEQKDKLYMHSNKWENLEKKEQNGEHATGGGSLYAYVRMCVCVRTDLCNLCPGVHALRLS